MQKRLRASTQFFRVPKDKFVDRADQTTVRYFPALSWILRFG